MRKTTATPPLEVGSTYSNWEILEDLGKDQHGHRPYLVACPRCKARSKKMKSEMERTSFCRMCSTAKYTPRVKP